MTAGQSNPTPAEILLIVDDDEQIRRSLERLLRRRGYECVVAEDATEARDQLANHDVALMLSDINMPGESGIELAERVLDESEDVAVLMVTGEDDPDLAAKALELGAYGYVIKPFKPSELVINVANALRRRALERQGRLHTQVLEQTVADRTSELRETVVQLERAHEELRDAHEDTIRRLSRAAEEHDAETGAHIDRVSAYARLVAERAGLNPAEVELIRLAAPLHDVGKVSIPPHILCKPGPLDEIERSVVETHCEAGYRILAGSRTRLLQVAAEVALTHHERYDGSGYPQRLAGTSIPIEGRIVAIADVFDALTSTRPYRAALSVDEATRIMRDARASHFDPELLDCFLGSLGEVIALRQQVTLAPPTARDRDAA